MRGLFSTLIIILIAGAIGFGLGVYVTPPEEAAQFHILVNEKLDQIKEAIRSAKTSKSDVSTEKPQAKAPAEPEPLKEAAPEPPPPRTGSNFECDPMDPKCAGAGGAPSEAAAPAETPSETAAEPSASPPEQSSETTPVITGARPATAVPPVVAAPAETAAKPAVVKTAAKPPVKKPKPKPKPVARPIPSEPVDLPAN